MLDLELLRKIDRIHPYPAKYTVEFAIDYINEFTDIGDTVFDPFVGAGTTLLASRALDRICYGTDVNHIAVLISSFKLMSLSEDELKVLNEFITFFKENYENIISNADLFFYKSINHWFCDESIVALSGIKNSIKSLKEQKLQMFCNLVFSSIINLVSNQESDTRYAAVEKKGLNKEYVAQLFIKKFEYAISVYSVFNDKYYVSECSKVFLKDSRFCCDVITPQSVDLLLTSPPYPNTYDYYLYHKHRMNWLEYDVGYSMQSEIGSRREYSSLKKDKEKFNTDLYNIFLSCDNTIKDNGYIVIVMGDGKIRGELYDAYSNVLSICTSLGWRLYDYSYTYLDDTSKSFQKSYRTKGKKEHILIFKKEK